MKFLSAIIIALALVCPASLLHADDASRKAAAEDLINAMHMEKILVQMKQNIIKMMSGFSSNQSPEARQRIEEKQSEMFDAFLKWDTLKPDYIQIYSEVYTEQELKDLASFYKSPIGQKFLEKMPELQQKSMEIMQKRLIDVMAKMKKIRDDAKAADAAAMITPDPSTITPSPTPK